MPIAIEKVIKIVISGGRKENKEVKIEETPEKEFLT